MARNLSEHSCIDGSLRDGEGVGNRFPMNEGQLADAHWLSRPLGGIEAGATPRVRECIRSGEQRGTPPRKVGGVSNASCVVPETLGI